MIHTSEESVFNMAMDYLKRISKFLYLCNYYSMNGDLERWIQVLRIIYRELSIKLNDKEKSEIVGESLTDLDISKLPQVTKENATFNNVNTLFNNKSHRRRYRQQLLYFLDIIEIKMRGKMQEKNMLLPSRADPRFAVLER